MGFINQFSRKINTRTETVISKDAGSGDIASSSLQTMGGAFVLLDAKVSTNPPVRLRLYTDSSSMVIDANRAAGNFNLSQSVGLIADINLTTTEKLVFAPPVIGHTNAGGLVWYNLSGSGLQNVTLTTYALSDIADSYENKEAIHISGSQVLVTGGSIYGVSGSITTPKSYAILKAKGTYNFNVDQQWERGNASVDNDGWEFWQTRSLTSELHTTTDPTKVTQQFPEIPVGSTLYAGQLATRTATFWKDNNFYYLPVDVGNVYRISGWVYATYDGTANDTLFGNYACGFFAIGADSSNNLIPDYIKATAMPSASWQYVSQDFSIAAGTSSILIGTFIDGPYPAGYGYGAPVCTSPTYDLQPLVCPGYGWFTGFTVENVTDYAARIRLYSTDIEDVPLAEKIRPFGNVPNSGSKLIADMMFDSASYQYPLVPVLEAYTWDDPNYSPGVNRTSYILENLSNVTTVYSGSLNADLTIYNLED